MIATLPAELDAIALACRLTWPVPAAGSWTSISRALGSALRRSDMATNGWTRCKPVRPDRRTEVSPPQNRAGRGAAGRPGFPDRIAAALQDWRARR